MGWSSRGGRVRMPSIYPATSFHVVNVMNVFAEELNKATNGQMQIRVHPGGALGIALLGSVLTYFYRGAVAGTLGGELPPQALDAVRDTLGGALASAAALPEPSSTALVSMARRAFVAAFRVTALTSAVIALLAAAAVVLLARPQESSSISTSDKAES